MTEEKQQNTSKLTIVKDGVEETVEVTKPTQEDIDKFKAEFLYEQQKFEETKWALSEKGKFSSNDVAMYLEDFMKKYAFWSKTSWMGMLKMENEITKAMNLADENTAFELDYQALEFCGYMLSNPGGVGMESAKDFEAQADKFAKIATVVGEKIEEARNALKNLQFLQERWAAAEQGFFLEDLQPKEENQEVTQESTEEDPDTVYNVVTIDAKKNQDE